MTFKGQDNNDHIKRYFQILLFGSILIFGTSRTMAQNKMQGNLSDAVVVPLWKGKAPFSKINKPEKELPSKGDGIIRITDVSHPSITIYPTSNSSKPRPALLISPGGGYQILAMNLEGTEIASWAKSIGFTPIILKYRVPKQRKAAFADIQRAMSILRSNAKKWNIIPDKIGIIGFSAGGNLSARLSTHYKNRIYKPVDQNDKVSMKPDFCILIYPAYLVDKQDHLKKDVKIVDQPPPTFLTQTQDDPIGYRNSFFFFNALTQHHVPAELHMFAKGGHGYGLRTSKSNPLSNWPNLCVRWLRSIHVIQ